MVDKIHHNKHVAREEERLHFFAMQSMLENVYKKTNNLPVIGKDKDGKIIYNSIHQHVQEIAKVNTDGIYNIKQYTDSAMVIRGIGEPKNNTPSALVSNTEKVAPVLKSLYDQQYFDNIVNAAKYPKSQTGSALQDSVILLNKNIKFTHTLESGGQSLDSTLTGMKKMAEIIKGQGAYVSWDLESLGGDNIHGFNQIDAITEFAFHVGEFTSSDGTRPVEKTKEMIQNIVGFSENDYKKVMKQLEFIASKPTLSGNDTVLLDRLAKTGHEMSTYESVSIPGLPENSVFRFTDFADKEIDGMSKNELIEQARKGANKLKDIGDLQDSNRMTDGTLTWQHQIKRAVNIINGNSEMGEVLNVGHNIVDFDQPMINRILSKIPGMEGVNINENAKTLDTYSAVKHISSVKGYGSLYVHGPKALHEDFGFMKLESLGRYYYEDIYNTGTAHVAETDSQVVSAMFSRPMGISGNGPTLFEYMYSNLEEINQSALTQEYLGPNKQLFLLNKGKGNTDGLSFSYNSFTNEIDFASGHSLDKSGHVKNKGYISSAAKKRGLYTASVVEITNNKDLINLLNPNINSDNVKSAEDLTAVYQSMAMEKVYGIVYTPVVDKSASNFQQGFDNVFVELVPSLEAVQTSLSGAVSVGTLKDGIDPFDEEAIKNIDNFIPDEKALNHPNIQIEKRFMNKGNLNVTKQAPTLDDLLEISTDSIVYDKSSETMRKLNYNQYKRYSSFYKDLDNILKKNTMIDSIKNKESKLSYRERNLAVAEAISNNKDLTLLFQDTLGYFDYSKKQQTLHQETLQKAFILQENFESLLPIFEEVEKQVTAIYGVDATGDNGLKRDYAFKSGVEAALTYISSGTASTEKIKQQIIDGKIVKTFSEDANILEINKQEIFPRSMLREAKESVLSEDPNIFTLKLSGTTSSSSLLRELRKEAGVTDNKKDFALLEEFRRNLLSTKEFKNNEALRNLDFKTYMNAGSSKAYSQGIYEAISSYTKEQRKENSSFGYSKKTLMARDVSVSNKVVKEFMTYADEESKKNLSKHIAENIKAPNFKTIGYDSSNMQADIDFLSNFIMGIKKDEYIKGIEMFESDKTRHRALTYMYDVTKKDVDNYAREIIEGMKFTNLNLVVMKDGQMQLIDRVTDVVENISLPKVNTNAYGHLVTNIDGENYVNRFVFNAKNILKSKTQKDFNNADINFISSFGTSIDYSFGRTVQKNLEKGTNPIDSIVRLISKSKEKLREATPRIERLTPKVANETLEIVYDQFYQLLPEFHKAGIIDELIKQGLVDESVKTNLEKFLDKDYLLNNTRYENLADMTAQQRNAFVQDLAMPLFNYLKPLNDEDKFLLQVTNFSNKDTGLTKSLAAIGDHQGSELDAYNNENRPLIQQRLNSVFFNKNKLKEKIDNVEGLSNVFINPLVTDEYERKALNGMIDPVTGEALATAVEVKSIVMDTKSLHKVIISDLNKDNSAIEKAVEEYKDEAYDYVRDKLLMASTYEQEAIIDSRLQNVAFNSFQMQKISNRKQILINHINDLEVLEELENINKLQVNIDSEGNVTYSRGRKVKKNDRLIKTSDSMGTEGIYGAKYDGLFKGGYFNEFGMVVSEEELTSIAKKNKITTTSQLDDFLMKNKYEFNYYVMPRAHSYGFKIGEDSGEKGASNSLMTALGVLDDKVKELIGGIEELKDEIGVIHHQDYFNDYINPILKEKLSKKDYDDVIKRINKEKNIVSDILFRGISELNVGANMISNQDINKHKNAAMSIKNALRVLEQAGKLEEGLAAIGLSSKNVIIDEYGNKQVIIPENYSKQGRDFNELLKVMEKSNIDSSIKLEDTEEVIGSTRYVMIQQLDDHLAGTSKGRNLDRQTKKEADKIEKKISQIKKALKEDLPKEEINKKTVRLLELQKQKTTLLEKEMIKKQTEKGLKYSDRTLLTLNRTKITEDVIMNLDERLKDVNPELYNKLAINITDDKFGKAILDPFIKTMEKKLFSGDGEVTLAEALKVDKDKYKYLDDSINNKSLKLGAAELVYSISAGQKAMSFNENIIGMKELLEEGPYKFEVKDIDQIVRDGGINAEATLADPNNIFNKNTIIDFGEEFGQNRYIAVGRGTNKVFGDSIIKQDHVKDVGKLAYMHELYSKETDIDEKADLKAKILAMQEKFKKHQSKDITSKEGLASELMSIRLNQSSFGKAKGLVMIRGENYDSLSIKEKYESLKLNNASFLDNAMFNNKSVMEHYADGVYLDVQFRSTKQFEDMGYFDKDLMKKRLKSASQEVLDSVGVEEIDFTSEDSMKSATKKLLTKYGDIDMATRFPEIMEGSVKPALVYLNESLADNEAINFGVSGISSKTDHDGDQHAVGVMTTSKGESYFDYILKGDKSKKELKELASSQELYITQRAVGENRYHEREVQKIIEKDFERATKSGALTNLNSKIEVGGKSYAPLRFNETFSYEDAVRESKKVEIFVDQANELIKNGQTGKSFNDTVLELIQNHSDNQDTINSLTQSFVVNRQLVHLKTEHSAKILKTTIGEANVTNVKLRKIYENFFDKNYSDSGFSISALQEILNVAEESVISGKKIEGSVDPGRAAQWNNAIKGIIKGNNIGDNLNIVNDWMDSNIKDSFMDRVGVLMEKFPSFRSTLTENETDDEIYESIKKNVFRGLQELGQSGHGKKLLPLLDFGESLHGMTAKAIESGYNSSQIETLQSAMIDLLDSEGAFKNMGNVDITSRFEQVVDLFENNTEYLTNEKAYLGKGVTEAIGNMVTSFSKGSGSGLGAGAITVAGSIIAAGFIGGNPSKPAETQAHEKSQNQNEFYSDMYLSDPDLSVMPSSNKGYVININANTKKGRKHVSRAIESAMQNSFNTNVNVSMNINEDYGNITNRDIENLLEGVLY